MAIIDPLGHGFGLAPIKYLKPSDTDHEPAPRKSGERTIYTYNFKKRNEDPSKVIKWMRRNFGDRGRGWDFHLAGGNIIVEIWENKFKTMYELWII